MCHSNERTLAAATCSQSFELSGEIAVLCSYRSPRRLASHPAQPWTSLRLLPLSRLPALSWLPGIILPGLPGVPRLETVSCIPYLGDKAPGRNLLYTWHHDPTGNSIRQILMLVAELFQMGSLAHSCP